MHKTYAQIAIPSAEEMMQKSGKEWQMINITTKTCALDTIQLSRIKEGRAVFAYVTTL